MSSTATRQTQTGLNWRRIAIGLLLGAFVLIGAGLWALATLGYVDRYSGRSEYGQIEDYVAFHAAGSLVADGRGGDIYDLDVLGAVERESVGVEGDRVMAFSYPPFVAVVWAPLGLLSLDDASPLIALTGVLLVAIAAAGLIRLLQPRTNVVRFGVLAGFLSFLPLLEMYSLGQMTMLLFLGWLGWVLAESHGRERLGGVALALLLVKPHVAVVAVAVLLLKRRWPALQGFAATGVVFAAVSLLTAGPSVVVDYPLSLVDRTQWDHLELGGGHTYYGWNGFFGQMLPWGGAAHVALTIAFTVLTLDVLYLTWRGPVLHGSDRFYAAAGSLVLAAMLVSPHVLGHELALAPLALALYARAHLQRTGDYGPWTAAGLGAWLLLLVAPVSGVNFVTPLFAALMLVELREVNRRGTAAPLPAHSATPTAA